MKEKCEENRWDEQKTKVTPPNRLDHYNSTEGHNLCRREHVGGVHRSDISTGHLLRVRNINSDPDWISCLREGAFYTNLQYHGSRSSYVAVVFSLPLLLLSFLLFDRCPVLIVRWQT